MLVEDEEEIDGFVRSEGNVLLRERPKLNNARSRRSPEVV